MTLQVLGYLARLREHAEGRGAAWLSICTGLSAKALDTATKLREALCLELAHWAQAVQTENYVRIEGSGFVWRVWFCGPFIVGLCAFY